MSEQNPLYQDIILDYYEFPRNRGRVDGADATCRGHNPSCGDDLTVSVKVVDGTIGSVMWDGHACAISEASASMMTEAVLDTPTESARAWVRTVRAAITGRGESDPAIDLGDADALRVVNNRPARVKCALLAWETLDEALTLAAAIESRAHTADGDA